MAMTTSSIIAVFLVMYFFLGGACVLYLMLKDPPSP